MATKKSKQDCQLFGDGESLIVFWRYGNKELAYTFHQPIVTSINVTQNSSLKAVKVMGFGLMDYNDPMEPVTIDIQLKSLPENTHIESSDVGGLFLDLDMFKNVSVSDLFFVINKKLEKREE